VPCPLRRPIVFCRWQSLQTNVPQHQRSPTRRGRLRCGGHSTAGSILDQARKGFRCVEAHGDLQFEQQLARHARTDGRDFSPFCARLMGERPAAGVLFYHAYSEASSIVSSRLPDERIALLALCCAHRTRRSRQLQHCCVLVFAQPREQHGLPVGELQRIVMHAPATALETRSSRPSVRHIARCPGRQLCQSGSGLDHRSRRTGADGAHRFSQHAADT
jgi:hypothetical protein